LIEFKDKKGETEYETNLKNWEKMYTSIKTLSEGIYSESFNVEMINNNDEKNIIEDKKNILLDKFGNFIFLILFKRYIFIL
jgi:hypothetical protein